MAKIKLRKGGGANPQAHPKTFVEQIIDKGEMGTSILKSTTPGVTKYGVGLTSGYEHKTPAEIRTLFGISVEGHGHEISEVTNLQSDLDAKVPLDGTNKVSIDYFPPVNVEALQFVGVIAGGVTHDVAVALSAVIPGLSAAVTSSKLNELKNNFVIASSGFFKTDQLNMNIDGDAVTVNFKWTSGFTYLNIDDDQDPNASEAVLLEDGDRIVFSKWSEVSAGVYDLEFGVINVNNTKASDSYYGTVKLAAAETARASLNAASDAEYVMDESALRSVMKDIKSLKVFTTTTGDQPILGYITLAGYTAMGPVGATLDANLATLFPSHGNNDYVIIQINATTARICWSVDPTNFNTNDPGYYKDVEHPDDPFTVWRYDLSTDKYYWDGSVHAEDGINHIVPFVATTDSNSTVLEGDLIIDYS